MSEHKSNVVTLLNHLTHRLDEVVGEILEELEKKVGVVGLDEHFSGGCDIKNATPEQAKVLSLISFLLFNLFPPKRLDVTMWSNVCFRLTHLAYERQIFSYKEMAELKDILSEKTGTGRTKMATICFNYVMRSVLVNLASYAKKRSENVEMERLMAHDVLAQNPE